MPLASQCDGQYFGVCTVSFKYDPFGRRIEKISPSTTSIFAYDGDNLVEETNLSGAAVARYEQALNIDEPLAVLRSAVTSYYHADGLSSVTSLSSAARSIAFRVLFQASQASGVVTGLID